MQKDIDFSPLRLYSKVFKVMRFIRRARMVLVRVILLLILIGIIGGMIWLYVTASNSVDNPPENLSSTDSYTVNYEINSDGDTFGAGWVFPTLLLITIGPWLLITITMSNAWSRFASLNGFKRLSPGSEEFNEITRVPSFTSKLLSTTLGPVRGTYDTFDFTLHSRQYKEGGLLRWRERRMDTILTLILPADLPHIVLNAKGNEYARQSNLTKKFPDEQKFQFEGTMGTKYDVYTKPESRLTAFQLFTPDVLQVLYSKLPTADVEMDGDKIWIIQRYGILDDRLAKTIFESADALYAELEKQIRVAGLFKDNSNTSVHLKHEA